MKKIVFIKILSITLLIIIKPAYAQDLIEKIYLKGIEYASQGEFEKAKEEFQKALEIDSFYNKAKTSLSSINDVIDQKINRESAINLFTGIRCEWQGQNEQAINCFDKVIMDNPSYTDAYLERGNVYSTIGNYKLAILDYTKIIEINPKYVDAYNNRSIVYYQQGNYDQCIQDINKAIELNPMCAFAYNNLGSVYQYEGQYDEAISEYNKAIEIYPNYLIAYTNRGFVYFTKGQYDQAISDYTKIIEIDPKYVDAYYNRAICYRKNDQYDKAINDYSKSIELNPKNAKAYDSRGFVYFVKLGDIVNGCADWKKACELGECSNYDHAKQNGDCP